MMNYNPYRMQKPWTMDNPLFDRELNTPQVVPIPNYRFREDNGIVPIPNAIPGQQPEIMTLEQRKYKPNQAEMFMQQHPLDPRVIQQLSNYIMNSRIGY